MSDPGLQTRRCLRRLRAGRSASGRGLRPGQRSADFRRWAEFSWRSLLVALSFAILATGCATSSSSPPVAPAVTAAREPANLGLLKQELKAYIDSGAYERGIAAVAKEAKGWVEERATAPARTHSASNGFERPESSKAEKLAIVFDLDETLLSNLPHIRARDFGYETAVWDRWVAQANAPAISSVAEVYHAARARGVTVFYITGRSESGKASTDANLRDLGLADHAALFCKPDGSRATSQSFKAAIRQRLTEEGYTIIANIGDQESDLEGGYAERTFKLPNPFYITR